MDGFVDYEQSLSSYSDEIYRPQKGENESDNEFHYSRKGWVTIWGEITLPELDNGDGDHQIKTN